MSPATAAAAAAAATAAANVARRQNIMIHRTVNSIRYMRRSLPSTVSVGYVPTMGALHDGHLALVSEARKRNDVVVASVFVNPTQFGEKEDLEKYPRQLERDVELLEDLDVDHVFAPDSNDMYHANHVTFVEPTGFDNLPEGQSRPGHFRGVATIVTKLFNIIQPTTAYFGQKDAAQCTLIRRIVEDLNIPVDISVLETVRDRDGLALSSRNERLSVEERRVAPVVYGALMAGRVSWREARGRGDVVRGEELKRVVERVLRQEPMVREVYYVSVDDGMTMLPVEVVEEGAVVSVACQIGSVRLIDNIVL